MLYPVSKVNLLELNELIRADRARLKRQPPARFASAKLSAERSARKLAQSWLDFLRCGFSCGFGWDEAE